ncbi:MAG: F0F1 ATP synthase subunit B [Clostridia bacterium]|nr:F0F1 ATP synthase subunit B [Clostridia bacterium]
MHFDFWTFLWTVLNISLVIFVLNKLLYKPLTTLMAQREQQVEDSLTKAAKDRAEATELLTKYQAQINEAKAETLQIIEKAAKTGEKIKDDIVTKANEEAERTLEKAKAELNLEKEKALAMVRDEAATLAVLVASKVVGKAITLEDHERMITEFMNQVGDVQ